jgi:hypothetical protein
MRPLPRIRKRLIGEVGRNVGIVNRFDFYAFTADAMNKSGSEF